MATLTKLSGVCSLLMACLLAYSASVQLDDPDWHFWLPLYACACLVNLLSLVFITPKMITARIGKLALGLGLYLFIKVVLEDRLHGIAGFWSLDLRERVVREKFGSGLVVFSMFLITEKDKGRHATKFVELGQIILVGIGYGLSLVFFLFQKEEMKS